MTNCPQLYDAPLSLKTENKQVSGCLKIPQNNTELYRTLYIKKSGLFFA